MKKIKSCPLCSGGRMNEHIALLKSEIDQLRRNLERAEARSGVKAEEIDNIRWKLRIKAEILRAVEAAAKRMEENDDKYPGA